MYCPKCGDEILRPDMRCEGCGSDLRRIIREEYWSEIANSGERPRFSDRFDHAGEAAVSRVGWDSFRRASDKRLYIIGAGSILIAVVLMILFIAFASDKTPDAATDADAPAPVAVVENPNAPPPPPPPPPIEQTDVEKFVESWRKSWEIVSELKKASDFVAFYADDFVDKNTARDKNTFTEERGKSAKAAAVVFVEISNLSINISGDRATATFDMNYLSDKGCRTGTTTLVIARRGGKLAIVEETYIDRSPQPAVEGPKINETVLSWRKSWEELAIKHELGALPTYYHPEFKGPKGRDSLTVMNQKLDLAKKNTLITIDIKDVKVAVLGDRAVASFKQVFQSMTYSDDGVKILVFKMKDGAPLITWEGFRLNKKLPSLDADNFWGQ